MTRNQFSEFQKEHYEKQLIAKIEKHSIKIRQNTATGLKTIIESFKKSDFNNENNILFF